VHITLHSDNGPDSLAQRWMIVDTEDTDAIVCSHRAPFYLADFAISDSLHDNDLPPI